jgi:hypothetical protein
MLRNGSTLPRVRAMRKKKKCKYPTTYNFNKLSFLKWQVTSDSFFLHFTVEAVLPVPISHTHCILSKVFPILSVTVVYSFVIHSVQTVYLLLSACIRFSLYWRYFQIFLISSFHIWYCPVQPETDCSYVIFTDCTASYISGKTLCIELKWGHAVT